MSAEDLEHALQALPSGRAWSAAPGWPRAASRAFGFRRRALRPVPSSLTPRWAWVRGVGPRRPDDRVCKCGSSEFARHTSRKISGIRRVFRDVARRASQKRQACCFWGALGTLLWGSPNLARCSAAQRPRARPAMSRDPPGSTGFGQIPGSINRQSCSAESSIRQL